MNFFKKIFQNYREDKIAKKEALVDELNRKFSAYFNVPLLNTFGVIYFLRGFIYDKERNEVHAGCIFSDTEPGCYSVVNYKHFIYAEFGENSLKNCFYRYKKMKRHIKEFGYELNKIDDETKREKADWRTDFHM